jgi:hypothetical protein
MTKIVYYTAKGSGCKPCEEITKLIEAGRFVSPTDNEIDLVDITTDEGFQRFNDEILSKQDGGVPSAYIDGKKCKIIVEGDVVGFECPNNGQPADPALKSSPAAADASHDAAPPDPLAASPSPQE